MKEIDIKMYSTRAYYWVDYYPKSGYSDYSSKTTSKMKSEREMIYEFKEGNYEQAFDKICDQIEKIAKKDTVFICIPASTRERHEKRFKIFMEKVSEKTGVINGYDAIKITQDREKKHEGYKGNCVNYTVDYDKIKNKNIIIFDDIFTYGRGAKKIITNLKMCRAQDIQCIFLGKTVHW